MNQNHKPFLFLCARSKTTGFQPVSFKQENLISYSGGERNGLSKWGSYETRHGQGLKVLLIQSCQSRGISILSGHIAQYHVHLLVSCPPVLSPAKIVQYLKGRTSRILQNEYPQLKKRYCGQHLWARGYFCATVGTITEEMIKEYIEKHEDESSRLTVEGDV